MTKLKKFWDDKKYVLWYALCFAALGLIDQRRGSAAGTVQMVMANLTGPVLAGMMLPSMKKEFVRSKLVLVWTAVCIVGIPAGMRLGVRFWDYPGQWNMAVINVAVAGYLILYLVWNRAEIIQKSRLNWFCFFVIEAMLFLMQISVHETLWPLWFFVFFGCFYLIGIRKELEEAFIRGMLTGLALWFFVQQILAFGFRPYDYPRYRGLYSGETQSGLFYMIAFCTFTGWWFWLRKKKARWIWKVFSFLLSAGSVGFLILTGGRSSLIGVTAAAVLSYMLYDLVVCKSFLHWIWQGILLGLCCAVMFPVVYGCVRYLPAVMHHPIWFEGEYASWRVHSDDPWDSDKYITFQQAVNFNLGRILKMFGIEFQLENDSARLTTPLTLKARAAEIGEPGSSADNPLVVEGEDYGSPMGARRTIYYYYATHLNWRGHTKDQAGFYYTSSATYCHHCHNMFLQFAYDYGILPGILFLVWSVICLIRLIWRRDIIGIIGVAFYSAIFVYGCGEMAVTTGQITLVMMFILYYFAMQKKQKGIEPEGIGEKILCQEDGPG